MPRTVPLPANVITRTLQVDPSSTVFGGSASLEVLVVPTYDGADVKLIKWSATNQYLISFFDVKRSSPSQSLFLELPTVDQNGFTLATTDEQINDWYYTVTVRYLLDGRKVGASVTKTVVPRVDTPKVILFNQLPVGNKPNAYQGPRGYSAFQLAVLDGFIGTMDEWLASLEGQTGPVGPPGSPGPQGVPGPAGPGGDGTYGAQSYIHSQMIPESTWIINHTLPFVPNIVVVDSSGTTVEGDINYPSPQQIIITFSGAFSGTAYLS